MASSGRDRVYVRSVDGKPTVVSSRPGNFAARLFTRHRVASLAQAKEIGLLPGFVDVATLEREGRRLLGDASFERDAERRVGSPSTARTGGRTAVLADDRVRQ